MKILGFRHTGIIVKNIKKSKNFYEKFLGLKVIQDFWDSTEYINKITGLKNAKVHMIKFKLKNGDVLEILEYPTHKTKNFKVPIHNVGLCHLALQISNIEKFYQKMKNKIKFISKPIISSEKFAKVCFCLDPDNTRIELVQIIKNK
jgi:catechol 2,3-dioxygenase-like lactoylglutathione lyase family enzyme